MKFVFIWEDFLCLFLFVALFSIDQPIVRRSYDSTVYNTIFELNVEQINPFNMFIFIFIELYSLSYRFHSAALFCFSLLLLFYVCVCAFVRGKICLFVSIR